MIRVRHNDLDALVDPSAYATLADLVAAYTHRGGEEQLLLRLTVDGNEYGEDEIEGLGDIDLIGVRDVRLESRGVRDVAISSLMHSADYADAICTAIGRGVDFFRTGQVVRANELCVDLADSLLVLAAALSSSISALEGEGEPLMHLTSRLNPWLEQLIDAQQSADWVRVADYLEFEIAPAVGHWGHTIRSCHERMSPTVSAHGLA